ncbi:MAG: DUF4436 family protein [Actinomycetes bacterium]
MLKIAKGMERIALSFLAIILVYAFIIVGISLKSNGTDNSVDDLIAEQIDSKHLDIFVQITDIDPLKGEAKARILPWPNDEYFGFRYRSGWMPKKDISIHVDSVLGNSPNNDNLYIFKKDIPNGGFDVSVDQAPGSSVSNVSGYPFDKYQFEVPISATYFDDKGAGNDLNVFPQDYTKEIDTFKVKMEHVLWADSTKVVSKNDKESIKSAVEEFSQGISSSIFSAQRSDSTKLLTFIILILMLTALASVTTMAFMVSAGRRPPTLSALIWSAALTFSLISLRDLFPGKPPIGILIDKVIYFPALLITLVCSLWILIIWTRREDYVN